MLDRRSEMRLMCADMVEVEWKQESGEICKCTGLLEDISPSGACLQLDSPVALGQNLLIRYRKSRFEGTVCYCFFKEIGYWVGMHFTPRQKWSRKEFRPKHLLDPSKLLARPGGAPRKSVQ